MIARLQSNAPWLAVFTLSAAIYLIAGCGGDNVDPVPNSAATTNPTAEVAASPTSLQVPEGRPDLLSDWGQLRVVDDQLQVAAGVVPYELNSALFSDYAHKLRTVRLPDGAEPAAYQAGQAFDFPVGTIITKTFYFPVDPNDADGGALDRVLKVANEPSLTRALDLANVRLIETRVLVRRTNGWDALPYVWNAEQTQATLQRTGDLLKLTLVDGDTETDFPYVVPDANQCASCHATNHTSGVIEPIGPRARHVNRDVDLGQGSTSQLEYWQQVGIVTGVPPASEIPRTAVWTDDTASLNDRARGYLDINCSHCHNSTGAADTSGLFLESSTEFGTSLGICKAPIAAGTGTGGRLVGIDPGAPDDSIFMFRLQTTDPASMMPELGRALVHDEGVELIGSWIDSLDGDC